MKRTRKERAWLRAWLKQIFIMLALCLIACALFGAIPNWLYGALLWGFVPLAGLVTAAKAVQGGLLNYAAWIAPPACLYAAHYAIWRFAPSAGAAMVCAFASLVGAAAGQVTLEHLQRQQKNEK